MCRSGVGVVVVQRFLLRGCFNWNFILPIKGRHVIPFKAERHWSSPATSCFSKGHLSREAWHLLQDFQQVMSRAGTASGPHTLSFRVVAHTPAQGKSGWQESGPQISPSWICLSSFYSSEIYGLIWAFKRPIQPDGVWRKRTLKASCQVTTVSLFGERYIDRWSPIPASPQLLHWVGKQI